MLMGQVENVMWKVNGVAIDALIKLQGIEVNIIPTKTDLYSSIYGQYDGVVPEEDPSGITQKKVLIIGSLYQFGPTAQNDFFMEEPVHCWVGQNDSLPVGSILEVTRQDAFRLRFRVEDRDDLSGLTRQVVGTKYKLSFIEE